MSILLTSTGLMMLTSSGVITSIVSSVTPPSATDFGALTRSGAGGLALPSGAASITNAGGTNLTVSSGFVVPASDGVTAGTVTFDNSDTWDITTTANAYSVRSDAECLALMTSPGEATVSGKTILWRDGTYAYNTSWINNRTFTSEVVIKPHGSLDDVRFTAGRNTAITASNVRFLNIDFYIPSDVSNGSYNPENDKGLLFTGLSDAFYFDTCRIHSDYKERLETEGIPKKLSGYTYRGIIAGASGASTGSGGIHILDCKIHGAWRITNLAVDGGPLIVEGNEVYDFGVDGIMLAGRRDDGYPTRSSVSWNKIHSPLNVQTYRAAVTAIDTTNNRITVADTSVFGDVGDGMNIVFPVGTVPSPFFTNQAIGASITSSTQLTLNSASFSDTGGAGSDLYVAREQDHADMIQTVAKGSNGVSNEDQYNIDWIGNELCGFRFDTFEADTGFTLYPEVQIMFLQDINNVPVGSNTKFFRNCTVAGNLGISRETGWGIGLHNAINSVVEHNTIVTVTGYSKKPTVDIVSHFSGGGSGNDLRGNLAASFEIESPNTGTLTNNRAVDVDTSDYALNFTNPGQPTSMADFRSRFVLLSGGPADLASPKQGASPHIDYDNRVYTAPTYP